MEAIREEKEASSDFFGKLIDERDATFVSKFMEDMMPTKLFCHKPKYINASWVFWSHESSDSKHTLANWGIQDRIKKALSKFYSIPKVEEELLVQFWAPEMIGGRRHLTTTLQPFALRTLRNEKLNEYRKHCVGYKFLVANVENDDNLSMDGIVGRVFQNKLTECCRDLRNYSVRDYPLRDLALSCGINSTVVFPLFEVAASALPCGPDYCVGVLELLFTLNNCVGALELLELQLMPKLFNDHLEEVGLTTIDRTGIRFQIRHLHQWPIRKEIQEAMKQVCNTYDISRTITWVSFRGEVLVPSPTMSIFPRSVTMETYFHSSLNKLSRQGLAEKAFLYNNPYFCRDVSKLSMSDHLLAQMARKLRLASCFIVCLRNISTGKHEFVIKFFPRKRYRGDIVTLFSSILATMKQQLQTFEVVTDPENEIFIEVDELGESFVKPMTSEGESIPTEY